jgi:hypothetical protein
MFSIQTQTSAPPYPHWPLSVRKMQEKVGVEYEAEEDASYISGELSEQHVSQRARSPFASLADLLICRNDSATSTHTISRSSLSLPRTKTAESGLACSLARTGFPGSSRRLPLIRFKSTPPFGPATPSQGRSCMGRRINS